MPASKRFREDGTFMPATSKHDDPHFDLISKECICWCKECWNPNWTSHCPETGKSKEKE